MSANKLYINGKWVLSSSGTTFHSLNPATEKSLGAFQQGNVQDVKKAIDAAEAAYPQWAEMPAPKRAQILFKARELLIKNKTALGKLVTQEMGKVLFEGLGDVQEAIDITEYMAGEGRRLFGHTTTSELKNKFAMTIRRPIGVCGLITPWNFPIAIPAWKIMPALICGNTVVFKPSSDTPLCATEFVKILEKAGIPRGVVNMVTGPGSSVGKEIVTNKKVRGLSFTGSKETGEYITQNAGIKKVGLELGGKNAIIIMNDADLKLALDGVIWGAFGTTGQRCTATSRVIVNQEIQNDFEKMLVKRTKQLRLGNGLQKSTDVGPLINQGAVEKTHRYTEIGLDEGARLLAGGKKKAGKGFYYPPTIFTNVQKKMRIAQEEIFGPSLSIITASDIDDAVKTANAIEYGLSSAVYTNDINRAFRAIEKLESGLTYINSSTIGAEVHLPFGGVKGTGSTREAGIEGIHEFSETKTVYVDYSKRLQKAQIDE
jgi:alpha-ketoglutaric semialdehyde dehydrogenase